MQEHLPENYLNSITRNKPGRNDLGHNPGVMFQSFALDRSVIRSLSRIKDFSALKVLDVGCGDGGSLINLIKLGFRPENLTGIDILEDRITMAKSRLPNVEFIQGDAAAMTVKDCHFDLVMESTMFIQLTDDDLSRSIASEMIRAAKPGGYIMLIDWRYSKPWDSNYSGLSGKRLKILFGVDTHTRIVSIRNGALIPFLGRFVSANCPALYFLLQGAFPFLAAQVTYLLQKPASNSNSAK